MKHALKFAVLLTLILGSQAFDLQCKFKNLYWNYAGGKGCVTFGMNITSPNQTATTIKHERVQHFGNLSRVMLYFDNQTVNYVPQGLELLFPNLKGFGIWSSKLKEVHKRDLAQFPNLIELWLGENELEILAGDLFEATPELRLVHLQMNKLHFVDEHIFEPLMKLKQAYFYENPCIDKNAESQAELLTLVAALKSNCYNKTIARLLEINEPTLNQTVIPYTDEITERICNHSKEFNQNFEEQSKQVEEINENLKDNLKEMEEKLKENLEQIEELKKKNAQYELKLKSIDRMLDAATRHLFYSSDQHEKLLETSTKGITIKCKNKSTDNSCEVFDLIVSDPRIKIDVVNNELGDEMSNDTITLAKLKIHEQETLFLPSNFAEIFPQLQEISVVDSNLFSIDNETFVNLTSTLTSVVIKNNKIRGFPENTFNGLVNLVNLTLSFNKIEIIPDTAFDSLENLRNLNLQYNLLTSFKASHFSGLSSLKLLKLHNNKIKFVDSNMIANLLKLSYFDISNNEIKKLSRDFVATENSILQFRAANNKLKIVDSFLIKRLKNSTMIDLSENPCIDVVYWKELNRSSINIENLFSKIVLNCEEDKTVKM